MQCSAPLVGIGIPSLRKSKNTGELELRSNTVLSRAVFLEKYRRVEHTRYTDDSMMVTYQDRGEDIFTGAYVFKDTSGDVVYPYPVPCGTCISCRLRRSAEWADRMTCETMTASHRCWFVTLTYDDVHVPFNDSNTALTLSVAHVDDFIKSYQNWCSYRGVTPRHYIAGEYGSERLRPHYHCILFDLDLPDAIVVAHNSFGDPLFASETLDKWWKHRGFVCLGACTWETCAYTARYVTKKAYGINADVYEKADLQPEFQKVSNRPGLGFDFFQKNVEKIFSDNKLYLPNGRLSPVPSYFDRKYQDLLCTIEDTDEALRLSELYLASKKKRAELARSGFSDKMHLLQVSENEYFSGVELLAKKSDKKLKRALDNIK